MRLPHTIGVELPRSGKGVFHLTFSAGLHLNGKSDSVDMPRAVGPRQVDQFSARAVLAVRTTKNPATETRKGRRVGNFIAVDYSSRRRSDNSGGVAELGYSATTPFDTAQPRKPQPR